MDSYEKGRVGIIRNGKLLPYLGGSLRQILVSFMKELNIMVPPMRIPVDPSAASDFDRKAREESSCQDFGLQIPLRLRVRVEVSTLNLLKRLEPMCRVNIKVVCDNQQL